LNRGRDSKSQVEGMGETVETKKKKKNKELLENRSIWGVRNRKPGCKKSVSERARYKPGRLRKKTGGGGVWWKKRDKNGPWNKPQKLYMKVRGTNGVGSELPSGKPRESREEKKSDDGAGGGEPTLTTESNKNGASVKGENEKKGDNRGKRGRKSRGRG